MKKRNKLEHPLPKNKGLSEKDILEISEEVQKAFQRDAALHRFLELEKLTFPGKGPNYKPTVFYQYSLSTGS